jgi:hypothetical protein
VSRVTKPSCHAGHVFACNAPLLLSIIRARISQCGMPLYEHSVTQHGLTHARGPAELHISIPVPWRPNRARFNDGLCSVVCWMSGRYLLVFECLFSDCCLFVVYCLLVVVSVALAMFVVVVCCLLCVCSALIACCQCIVRVLVAWWSGVCCVLSRFVC